MNNLETTKPFLKAIINDLGELSNYIEEAQKIAQQARMHIFLDEYEAAPILSLTVEELRTRRTDGRPPFYYKLGKHVRYSLLDLLDYIEGCKRRSTSQIGPLQEH